MITTLTYTSDETPPKAPAKVPLSDLESVLEYFYQLEMHTIRYSFERYKPGVWLYFPFPSTEWERLIGELMREYEP